MARYNVFKNGSLDIIASSDYQDNGWSVSAGNAIHDSLNEGYLENTVFLPIQGDSYVITLNVLSIQNGSFKIYLGDVLLEEYTTPGIKTIVVDDATADRIRFWSDADMYFNSEIIKKGEVDYKTFLFDNDNNAFAGYMSYTVDFMSKFLDDFYSFENGALYRHNVNDSRNTFRGVLYPSRIKFYVNAAPTEDKDFYSMLLNSTDPWYIEEILIEPTAGKSKGQLSRIKSGNFKNYKGKWVADFLRDMNDPRFSDKFSALMNGAQLMGKILVITMSNTQTSETRLVSVETEFSLK